MSKIIVCNIKSSENNYRIRPDLFFKLQNLTMPLARTDTNLASISFEYRRVHVAHGCKDRMNNIWLQNMRKVEEFLWRKNENSFQGATIVKASHFELDYMLGRKITFFCMARGYPRPEITWFKDGIELYHHKFFQVQIFDYSKFPCLENIL